ncbi:aldehyde dehydrogenase family protein [Bradyrhizobium embrapense]|uniref:aldehyde dehydrogenase family protein n=1 Tax=Bradyrhizobium embrapense TaxID=630921 RepID=UPI00067BB70F|nr:aldehyde dehydrogenase family protein [Bradyrhizobium embrapense]
MPNIPLYDLYVNGAWRSADTLLTLIDPATAAECGRVAVASTQDLDDVLATAQASLSRWSRTPAADRGAVLIKAAHLLLDKLEHAAAALSREQGKTLAEAKGEYRRAIETFEWAGANATKVSAPIPIDQRRTLIPEAVGVVAAFTPWNYPAVLNARKLTASLIAGCPVILKAAEETPSAAVFMVEALHEAGIPPGVISLVYGEPAMISEHLLGSPYVRALSFTGSTHVGKLLARLAADNLQRCVLELGGHSPVLVSEDADIPEAVRAITEYKFECAGQSCNAPSRILVARSIYEPFLAELIEAAETIKVGLPTDKSTDMGPMANGRRIAAMDRLTRDAVALGARVETGGSRLNRVGFYWPPTILTNVHPDSQILREEPFGPILTVAPYDTLEEAIAEANASEYGLASYVFAKSHEVQTQMAKGLAAGAISVNHLKGVSVDAPNAGVKQSGYGYEGGLEGVRAFQNLKLINWNTAAT